MLQTHYTIFGIDEQQSSALMIYLTKKYNERATSTYYYGSPLAGITEQEEEGRWCLQPKKNAAANSRTEAQREIFSVGRPLLRDSVGAIHFNKNVSHFF